jgi:hypothetical protein
MKTVLGSINHHNTKEIEARLRDEAAVGGLSLSLTPDLWGDLSNKTAEMKERLSYFQGLSNSIVVDGHFLFLPVEVRNGSWDFQQPTLHRAPAPHNGHSIHFPLAYFNILRAPASRVQSQFYYEKFEGERAKMRSQQGLNASDADAAGKGILDLGDDCADSSKCSQWLRQKCTRQMQHLCGSSSADDVLCSARQNTLLNGALVQVSTRAHKKLFKRNGAHGSSRNFDVLGLTEHMLETLEMLECAFPRAFSGATERYRAQPVHNKSGIARSNAAQPSARTAALLQNYCADEQALYDEAKWAFWARHEALKASREEGRGGERLECCRSQTASQPRHGAFAFRRQVMSDKGRMAMASGAPGAATTET